MAEFNLHPQLHADTRPICRLPLCECLLLNDRRFPWVVLVPRVGAATELLDLDESQTAQLWLELRWASQALLALPEVSKLNVGALGNLVPQLHVHVIGRHPQDAAWPGPVWGHGRSEAYADPMIEERLTYFRDALSRQS